MTLIVRGIPWRSLVNERDRLAREHLRPDAAGGPDAAGDIAGGLLERERPQLAAQRDALLQLPQRLRRSADRPAPAGRR